MKNARPQTTEASALDTRNSSKFTGTDNPRHLRAIALLLQRPAKREELDNRAGCSNSPELVAELRRRGLDAPCERVPDRDRDGKQIRRGVYFFTSGDRRKLNSWMSARGVHHE